MNSGRFCVIMTVLRRAALIAATALAMFPLFSEEVPTIVANDNRVTAGELRNGALALRIEMRKGIWHPEQEDGEGIAAYAFGEAGKPLQVPGPAIRVPVGTTIEMTLHNRLAVPATVYGLHRRPGSAQDVIVIEPGRSKEIRFVAGEPGTYLYWARTPDGGRGNGRVADALLGGAFVVDPPGAAVNDRIFVFERWNGPTRTAINGKSWPYTERLNFRVGETVRWRMINASDLSHPMHLHGFHFTLDGEGDGESYKAYPSDAKPLVFTHSAQIGHTFDMTWTPKEPGRWLYHCHRIPHMRLPVPLDKNDIAEAGKHSHAHMHDMDSDYSGMGGMIMGITVEGPSAIDTSTSWRPERVLQLTVDARKQANRTYQLSLRDRSAGNTAAGQQTARTSTGLAGPPIVLSQNQPAEIVVENRLNEPTTIHWHGLEMESYYDGVPGWGGRDGKKTPVVLPGQSFGARMIPHRAGTFIYHTHWHDETQLSGGIHGALIVMPAGKQHDPATDKSFVFSQSPNEPYGNTMVLMNGVPQPGVMRLRTGTTYRLRFINISATLDNLRVSLLSDGKPVKWRLAAKDAVDSKETTSRIAEQTIGISETYDFEFSAARPQELTLVGLSPNDNRRVTQTLIFRESDTPGAR